MRRAARLLPVFFVLAGALSLARAQETQPPEKKQVWVGVYSEGVALEGSPAKTAIRLIGIFPGSPAETAQLKVGDLVTAIDGKGFTVEPKDAPNDFRARILAHSPGDKVRLSVRREALAVDLGSGPAWVDDLPDLKKLLDESPGKVVTVSAERALWTREVPIVLGERPGTRSAPLPPNATLRPDLEAQPLEPEADLARRLIERLGQGDIWADVRRRLEDDEMVEDPFRLKTVRYLKRDPLRLPGATKALGRALAPCGKPDLRAFCEVALSYLDCETAPILTTLAPEAPPAHSTVPAHVNYCLDLMRRARDLAAIALADLSQEEKQALERDLPTLAERFKEGIYLHEDPDRPRWKRHERAIELLAKVKRGAFVQGLRELAPLASPSYLDRLEADLREAEQKGAGTYSGDTDAAGVLLYRGTSELGSVVVGGSGPNEYRGDHALIIDLGGDDKYFRRAGGASGLGRPVSVSIDLAGDDRYQATEPFAQGAALLGVGLLVDRSGNDCYTSLASFSQGAAVCGAAAIVDLSGNDVYRGEAYAQGAALAQGAAALLDGQGDDRYEAAIYSQGFAGPGGFGALIDGAGNDHYAVMGRKESPYGDIGTYEAHGQGSSCGFRTKASGGIGVLVDCAGSDFYEAGCFSQGCGYYFGWGALVDLGNGDDRYEGTRYAQGAAAHSAVGSFWDEGGNDRFHAWIGAAQSLAWDLSVTCFLEGGGKGLYDGGDNLSQGAAAQNGFSLFYAAQGETTHRLIGRKAPGLSGPNEYHGGHSIGVFLKGGGEKSSYDVAEGTAFVPSRGIGVWADRSIFGELPCPIEKLGLEELDRLLAPKR